jgi:arabinose-5-phosphate isomerase
MEIRDRIKAVLDAEASAIKHVEVTELFIEAVTRILECRGRIVSTGMGKAGLAARRFAATLSSTGTPALFLHPAEAAHGDLGILSEDDYVVAFSTSGKTEEVLRCLTLIGQFVNCRIIAITSHRDAAIRQWCDIVLDMGEIQEPCPLGLTPSASIAAMSAIGDAIAIAVMEQKGITIEDYGKRHHGGYLGDTVRLRLAKDKEGHGSLTLPTLVQTQKLRNEAQLGVDGAIVRNRRQLE